MPIIIWQDLRSSEMIPEIKKMLEEKGSSAEELYDRCGMPLGGVNPQSNLQWIKRNMPEAYENATTIHTMMGLVTKAFGADDYYDDYTDTPWLQLNGPDFQYDPEICDLLEIDINKLAPLRKPGEVIEQLVRKLQNLQVLQQEHRLLWVWAISRLDVWAVAA